MTESHPNLQSLDNRQLLCQVLFSVTANSESLTTCKKKSPFVTSQLQRSVYTLLKKKEEKNPMHLKTFFFLLFVLIIENFTNNQIFLVQASVS